MIKEIEKEIEDSGSGKKRDKRPVLIKWKNAPMLRRHSIIAAVKEMLSIAAKTRDVTKISIIGEESTGKTSIAEATAHLLHVYAEKLFKLPFAVRMFGEEEFLNFKETLATLAPTNHILYFRDLSFLQDKKAIGNVKQAVTKIRHLPGGQDVKIILIYDYHYSLALDKYLRQSHFKIFTSAGSSETENMQKLFGGQYNARINEAQRVFTEQMTKQKATFRIGPKDFFTYPYWDPFGIVLFWNGVRPRFIVYPLRTWIDRICPKCTIGQQNLQSELSIEQVKAEGEKNFGEGGFKSAVKLEMFSNGIITYSPTIVKARRWLVKLLQARVFSLEELAVSYDMKITKTKLRKSIENLL